MPAAGPAGPVAPGPGPGRNRRRRTMNIMLLTTYFSESDLCNFTKQLLVLTGTGSLVALAVAGRAGLQVLLEVELRVVLVVLLEQRQ